MKKLINLISLVFLFLLSGCIKQVEPEIKEFECDRQLYVAKDDATGRGKTAQVERTSNDGKTKIVVTYYSAFSNFANNLGFSSNTDGARNTNHLSVSVDPDEVLVGGGAAVCGQDGKTFSTYLVDGTGREMDALLSSSYPVNDNTFSTWSADSKDVGIEFKHVLEVFAVGMKVYYQGNIIPAEMLKTNMSIVSETDYFDGPQKDGIGATLVAHNEDRINTNNWKLLAGGVKACWSGDQGGIFIRSILNNWKYVPDEISTDFSDHGQYTVKGGIVESYCLSIKNINPMNPSTPLFYAHWSGLEEKITANAQWTRILKQPWLGGMVVSAMGNTKTDYGFIYNGNGDLYNGNWSRKIYALYPTSYGGELFTRGHIVPNIVDSKNNITLLEILPY